MKLANSLPVLLMANLAMTACTRDGEAGHEVPIASDGGGDWPQFGGTAARNMVSNATGVPIDFDPGDFKEGSDEIDIATAKHLVWVAKTGTQSHRAPVIAGGKVLTGTNNEVPRDKKHEGDRGVLMCFDERTGEFLWQFVALKLATGKVQDWDLRGITSSALIHGDRAYVVTNRCEVVCLDLHGLADGNDRPFGDEAKAMTKRYHPLVQLADADADIIWLYNMRRELGVFPHNISSSSPTLFDGMLVVNTCNGTDWTHLNIPSPEAPSLVALDPDTGELVGEEGAGVSENIMHGSWSSPAAAVVDGEPAIVFGGGDGFAYRFGTETVEDEDGYSIFPEIWKVDGNPPGYRFDETGEEKENGADGGPSEFIGSPVIHGGRVYMAIGQGHEYGAGLGMLSCIDAATGKRVWGNRDVGRTQSTPSVVDGLVFIADFQGCVHCIDATSGETHWSFDTGGHIWGSTMVVDGKVYVGNEDGEVVILAAAKSAQEIGRVEFDVPIYATPVVANGKLYITTLTHLFAFALEGTQ